jgi:peroxiredoxin
MKRTIALVLVLFSSTGMAGAAEKPSPVGKKVSNFTSRDYRGAEKALADFADRKIVVLAFVGTECPVAKLYGPRLASLAKEYEPKGVAFIGVDSNQQDAISAITHFAKLSGINFPILKDVNNVVADQVGAVRTPEVVVLDDQRVIRYCGRIDDQYGVGFTRPKATQRDLGAALNELLAGKEVTRAVTQAEGCYIGRVRQEAKNGNITYAKDIASIFQNRCVGCHQPGEIGPFSLTNYDEVVGWADTIRDVVKYRRMPPWFADPKYGQFSNDCHLPEEERQLILKWIDNDAPRGDPNEIPKTKEALHGWRIPKPDVVLTMAKPFKIAAEGTIPYQFFAIDTGFTEDKWIQAAEVRPGCRQAVHHVLVFVQPPGRPNMGRSGRNGFISDWLVSSVPGSSPMILAEGMAKRVPAGSRLLIQMHYTVTGKVEHDQTSIALVFADPKSVKQEVTTDMAVNPRFTIPPNNDNYKVEAAKVFDQDTLLLTLMPHTHLRGRAFKYEATYPDGAKEVLLDVPNYDFNWQMTYVLAKPKLLPKGTELHCVAYYNNSKSNFSNPNPNATVRWGEQTWEEMMIGYFDGAPSKLNLAGKPAVESKPPPRESAALDAELQRLAERALDSQEAFDAFAAAVHKSLPKLDRLCVTTFGDDRLRVVFASYPGAVTSKVAETGFESPPLRNVLVLGAYALFNRTMRHPDLSKAQGGDLNLMKSTLASSVHVPVIDAGRPGTMNFWSKDKAAFPKEQEALLHALADAALKGR